MTGGVSSFLISFLAFVIILVPLVVFHEFGHFVFARLFGVRADIFSVGFGPSLWSKQIGETEFRISAIPMGGYVKLLGEDQDVQLSPEEQARALHKQAPWKRFFIFLGGPLFNFILAIFIFMVILMIGEPQVSNIVGRVVHGSQAEKVGFQSGDQILFIGEKPIKRFDEIFITLNESPGKALDFKVLHPDSSHAVDIIATPVAQTGFSIYGESKHVGEIEGLLVTPRANFVGISDPKSPAAQGGLESNDLILDLNGVDTPTWEKLEQVYTKMPVGAEFSLRFQKAKTNEIRTVRWKKASASLGKDFGLFSSELFVDKVVKGSPAEGAGVLSGDRLVGVNGKIVQSFFELKDSIQHAGEQGSSGAETNNSAPVHLVIERGGKQVQLAIQPTATQTRDPILNKTVQYTIGVIPMLVLAEPATFIERIWNPLRLIYSATERMVTFSWRNFVSLRKMITGDVSVGTIGGPLMIGKIAGESLTRGLIAFLTNMAIFSIGLGVLNILPVPVLDGGHLLLLGIEAIRGKPLTIRQMEIIQGVGLMLILALMGIAFRNDIARLFYS